MKLLKVDDLGYQNEDDSFRLSAISFEQLQGQNIALSGETGSGKTTLLKIIAGSVQSSSGEMFFENEKLRGPDWQLIPGHAGIVYLSQHFELRNNYRMEELLAYGNELSADDSESIYRICRIEHLFKRHAKEVSGGERQRIALAKLLVTKPRLLLLDEPFSNLDSPHKKILKQVLTDVSATLGITTILASHDPADTLPWADRIIVLQNGRIVQQGSPTVIYRQPINEYVAALFGDYNLINEADSNQISALDINTRCEGKIFIRPETLCITPIGVKATVLSASFLGSCYQIEVAVEDLQLTVSHDRALQIGDVCCISLKANSPASR